MKLLTYRRDGQVCHGRLIDGDTVQEWGDGDLSRVVAAEIAPRDGGREVALTDVEVLAPILRPGKVFAAAANYQEHVEESGGARLDKSRLAPRLFLKPVTAVCGTGTAITLPRESSTVDWEAELVVVIGATASRVSVQDALGHVAGYATGNDVSARSLDYGFAREIDQPGTGAVWFFDWLIGKGFDGFAPYGPFLVTREEVPDPQSLPITLDLNGVRRQHGSTAQMIFTVAELVSFASRATTLEPGDLIFTGTPDGVGAATGEYLRDGDRVDVSVGDLGLLTNTMKAP
jgi:2-keto-4-pentenoate hydratase/2-oxohepta-3-ene-1,7-dioic acid hydratase in catechol pathway